jgi:hypothetical protein
MTASGKIQKFKQYEAQETGLGSAPEAKNDE